MTFEEACAALDRRSNYERSGRLTSPSLERIAAVCELLANPERSFPSIHVTGTNGKTTTAHVATEVLRATGLRIGTFTSAHVGSVRERLRYHGRPIAPGEFAELWEELAPVLEIVDAKGERAVTWFEAVTALAFLWFSNRPVDAAVIEVGMGGSWDATNVIEAPVAAVAAISLDHADVLGPGIADIAREKAGVIKPGAIACSLEQPEDAFAALRARCEEVGATLRVEGGAFGLESDVVGVGGRHVSIRAGDTLYADVFVPVHGAHLARDAALGLAAARAFLGDRPLPHDVVAQALGRLRVPGRMEVVHRAPLVVLDGAHNPAASSALAEAMRDTFRWDRLWLVVGIMADKDARGTLEPLVALADDVIVTRAVSPRAAETTQLAAEVRALGKEAMEVANVPDAVSVALEHASRGDCVVVSGSLYTVGEARRILVKGDR